MEEEVPRERSGQSVGCCVARDERRFNRLLETTGSRIVGTRIGLKQAKII